jgi:hypothetical protein
VNRASSLSPALIISILLSAVAPSPSLCQALAPPPDAAAMVRTASGHVTLTYGGRVILDAALTSTGPAPEERMLVDTAAGAVTQVIKWTALRGGGLTLEGMVLAGTEAFACATEPRHDAPTMVRNAVGPADSRLNRAVYDRGSDWVLSVDEPTDVRVSPEEAPAAVRGTDASGADTDRADPHAAPTAPTDFHLRASGQEIILRFRPRYYQKHRGLGEYRPWTYGVWRPSVAGWTSW